MRRDVFQAIADPTRRAIIDIVASQSLSLNAVAEQFDISRPAISKHIKILTECGLIVINQQGRERFCQANLGQLKQVVDWTEQFHAFWSQKLDALGAYLEKEQQIEKHKKSSTSKTRRK